MTTAATYASIEAQNLISKHAIGGIKSVESSPLISKATPSKILGDYHLAQINKVFENF